MCRDLTVSRLVRLFKAEVTPPPVLESAAFSPCQRTSLTRANVRIPLSGGLQAIAELLHSDFAAHGHNRESCLLIRRYSGMALTNLTFGDGNNKAALCSMRSFMTSLVAQLDSRYDDLKQVTASVLRNLSWRADSMSRVSLRESGSVISLTKCMMSMEKEGTLKSVLSALWNLSAHCTENKVQICSVDGALGFLVG